MIATSDHRARRWTAAWPPIAFVFICQSLCVLTTNLPSPLARAAVIRSPRAPSSVALTEHPSGSR